MLKQCLSRLLVLVLLTVGVISCSSVDKSDPKSVLQDFFDKIAKKDIDGAMALATNESQVNLSLMKLAINMAQDGDTDKKKDFTQEFKDVTLGDAKIESDKAIVTVSTKKEQYSIDVILKKQDGSWKVDFSKEALMRIGLGSRSKSDRKMETDSLTIEQFDDETMQRANDLADSVLENIDPKKLEQYQKEGKERWEKLNDNN